MKSHVTWYMNSSFIGLRYVDNEAQNSDKSKSGIDNDCGVL